MKLLTLNLHSHDRSFDRSVLREHIAVLARFLMDEKIDILALQECSQQKDLPCAQTIPMRFLNQENEIPLREENAALLLAQKLAEQGMKYEWTWTGVKLGYDLYEEGLALFSRLPIAETEEHWISGIREFACWKSRKALMIRLKNGLVIFDVHMGWWNDEEERFREQMDRLQSLSLKETDVLLMGDFNAPSDVRGEGYDRMKELGWTDTYDLAEQRDSGITVPGSIDGWRNGDVSGMRLDYIWTRKKRRVLSSSVVLNGIKGPAISDHVGVRAVIEDHS